MIGDYLLAEALERMPERDTEFLLRTSVTPRICGSLADAITGADDSAALLEGLLRTNGFVLALDDHDEWFRYHPLFGELLRARLRHRDRALERECHRRAALWHATRGLAEPALRHAASSGDDALAAELVIAHWLELFAQRERRLHKHLNRLSPELVAASAALSAIAACVHFSDGDAIRGRACLETARRNPADACGTEALAMARLLAAACDGDFEAAREAAVDVEDTRDDVPITALKNLALGTAALWSFDFAAADRHLLDAASTRAAAAPSRSSRTRSDTSH